MVLTPNSYCITSTLLTHDMWAPSNRSSLEKINKPQAQTKEVKVQTQEVVTLKELIPLF